MTKPATLNSFANKSVAGFTLLELIIVMVLVGVLSVVAATRFQSRDGFDSVAIQNQIIATLRHMQLRAMQDTRAGFCHRMAIIASPAAVGPVSNDYSNGNQTATCAQSIGANTPDYLRVDNAIFSDLNASITALDGTTAISYIDFDSLGRPITAVGGCTNECVVSISTTSTSSICVNSEGFIRDC